MILSRSSNMIKSCLTKGQNYNKIQVLCTQIENFHQTGIGFRESLCRKRGNQLSIIESYSALAFNVRRSEPELVRPSWPTPNKLKLLSDIDEQDMVRYHHPIIMFYPAVSYMKDRDPAKVIKNALAEALAYYYPWAGRISNLPMQKLAVDCTSEGVVFLEADADITLEELGEQPLVPPYPYLDQLLYNYKVDDPIEVIRCPMLTMQVTRLSCGGFILALRFYHAMSDAAGIILFLTTVTEFARGASAPSIHPVWRRDLLNSGGQRPETPNNRAQCPGSTTVPFDYDMVRRTFIFNSRNVATLRGYIPRHLRPHTTTFELIAATLWQCRTIALQYQSKEEVRFAFVVNTRPVFNPPLPAGYYGNAITLATAVSTAGKIYDDGDLSYVVELVKKAKGTAMEEHRRSLIDPGILRGNHLPMEAQTYMISDASRLGFLDLDFGWGNPIYCSPADNSFMPHVVGFITSYRNGNGEEVKVVPVCLPEDAMGRFGKALDSLLKESGPATYKSDEIPS